MSKFAKISFPDGVLIHGTELRSELTSPFSGCEIRTATIQIKFLHSNPASPERANIEVHMLTCQRGSQIDLRIGVAQSQLHK